MVFETALVMGSLVLLLEAVHYRNALIESNLDRKGAWSTVVDLRHKLERCGTASGPRDEAAPPGRRSAQR